MNLQISYDGNLPTIRPAWQGIKISKKYQEVKAPFMSHPDDVRRLMVEEGEVRSFLTDKFPECKPARVIPRQLQQQNESE